jgi:endoglucanase
MFEIRRGTNISHWLSQSRARGAERRAWFTEDDVQRIAGWGFDHIRLPIDEE